MSRKAFFKFCIILLLFTVMYIFEQYYPSLNPSTGQAKVTIPPVVLDTRTKTSGCIAKGSLPDIACTPGTVFPEATIAQICTSGYTKTVRNVSAETKRRVYAEYGIATHAPGEYEVDHLISLELGGSNDIANLWPEAADPFPGFHEKDVVENYLHSQVCSGKLALPQAQKQIAGNWLSVYRDIK